MTENPLSGHGYITRTKDEEPIEFVTSTSLKGKKDRIRKVMIERDLKNIWKFRV